MNINIPQQRLLLYIIILGLLPIAFAASKVLSLRKDALHAENALQTLHDKALQAERRESQNKAVRKYFLEADHFYIDRQLESLSFLNPEQQSLQQIVSRHHVITDDKIIKRLEQLTTGNKMVFSEGSVQTYPFFQETLETLVQPVEINVEDLRNILSKIEGVPIGQHLSGANRLQLIITFFKLDKKNVDENNETFELNLKLLKREFL